MTSSLQKCKGFFFFLHILVFYERQATKHRHYRRSRNKPAVEMTVISIFMLVSAALSAWLPYLFAELVRLGPTP